MSLVVVIGDEEFSLTDYNIVTIDSILLKIAKSYGLAIGNIKRPTRRPHLSRIRQISMYVVREYFGTKHSYRRIGESFGLRDHTAVMHACKVIPELMKHDAEMSKKIEELKQLIGFDSRPNLQNAAG